MKNFWLLTSLVCMLGLGFALESSAADYTVYCSNGKLEVDTRNVQQMKSARGHKTYAMSTFKSRLDAEKFIKQLHGQCPKK